jgi:hypothetical protein
MLTDNPMHNPDVRKKLSETIQKKYDAGYISPSAKKWKITDPMGNILIIENLHTYCKSIGLKYHSVYSAFQRGSAHKGYKIQKT